MATHNFGDNIVIEETSGGTYRITHTPSGQTTMLGPDGWQTDVTKTDELSVTEGDAKVTTNLIDVVTDSDTTTVFDYDTGPLSETFDGYLVKSRLVDGSNSANTLKLQLNGVTTASYSERLIDGTSITSNAGTSSLTLFVTRATRYGLSDIFIQAESGLPADPTTPLHQIGVEGGGVNLDSNAPVLHDGDLTDSPTADVDRLRIFSTGAGAGQATIIGVNER